MTLWSPWGLGRGGKLEAGQGWLWGQQGGKKWFWESHSSRGSPCNDLLPAWGAGMLGWAGGIPDTLSLLCHSVGLKGTLLFPRSVSRATLPVEKQHAWIILHRLPALRYWMHISLSLFPSLSSCLSEIQRVLGCERREQQGLSQGLAGAPAQLFTVKLQQRNVDHMWYVLDAKIPEKPVNHCLCLHKITATHRAWACLDLPVCHFMSLKS